MASPNPFLQFVPNRAESVLRRVRERIWYDRTPVPVTAAAPTREHRLLAEAKRDRHRAVAPGSAWGRLYDQRWFHVALPRSSRGDGPRWLEWRDQGEATLYVAGSPYYGFDVAHRYVALPDGVRECRVEGFCCQSAIWHPDATGLSPEGSVFGGAFLVRRDDEAWNAWHELRALFDLAMSVRSKQTPAPPTELARFGQQPLVDQATPLYRRILHLLDRALDAFDTDGIGALAGHLRAARAELVDARPEVRAVLTGHAHVDLVWLWPERMGEAKAVHTFATANRLIGLYPEFRFAYSQPASYRAVARRAPALAKAVRDHIERGAWEATGALDVESDTLLPCGEALARSFLLGQEEFVRLRGSRARLLWLPDVFGYSGCLPQLMRLSGVEWFFTTKLTWSAVNRFPYSSFVWRGTDGSEVVAHVTQNVGYNNRLELAELDANARGHAQSHVHAEFLHPTGYGDGGGGPTEEMCERARRLDGLAGTPALAWDQPEAFFARLATHRDALPVHQGECYLEYHRGTYTTHGALKAAFRGLERALQIREAVAVATGTAPDLTATWRRLVFAQFHDYIPGSSIAEVYAEGVPELERLARTEHEDAQASLAGDRSRSQGTLHAFNPLPLPWSGWVDLPDGRPARCLQLPPLSGVAVDEDVESPMAASVDARPRMLSNERLRAEFADDGTLRTLHIDGTPVALAGAAALPVLYPDRPANYDAWDIDRHSLALGVPLDTPVTWTTERPSPHRAALVATRPLGKAGTLCLRWELRGGEAVLRVTAEVDWREPHTLLRLHFPTAYRGRYARFGAPFGSALRVQQPGELLAEAQWEVPGSRWAAVCNDGERDGLALVTEAKYGFSARDGDLTVSLLRGARITGCDDHRYAAPPGLSRTQPPSPFSDQGRHVIRLALGRYSAAGPREIHPAALADTLFTTPIMYRGTPLAAGLLDIDGAPTLLPAWAAPLERRAWLLRLHEVSGDRGIAKLRLAAGWQARACALDGTPEGPARAEFVYEPYRIMSLRIERKR
ncbi:glycoside hydrolase family 38 C-terminal domain-containing protein [Opitutales bacterium ASA1]|uniref:alpha-mannosidase n=1 Tax=Congregicoccus parvus TaxID=3081749 RepID=UPI002B28BEE0|nr:glycoside hydrolase family 38 C-terminal domain-containing protein [Opitutales bacterium ASA1]